MAALNEFDAMLAHNTSSRRRLERIAGLLGCSVEAFFTDDRITQPLDEVAELIVLWRGIKSDEERRKFLEIARKAAGAQTDFNG